MMYCGYYLCRKNLSVLLPYLKTVEGYTSEQLAHVLFVFSVSYSLGQFVIGRLSDRFGARMVVTIGAIVSAVSSALMGAGTHLGLIQGTNGFAQSAGWPGVLKMARAWFPDANRGVVMAWWGTHLVAGGFLGTALASSVADTGWRRATWIPALALTGIALVFGAFSRDGADRGGVPARLPRKLVLNRALVSIAVMYFFVKLTRYAFLFWLPLYMTEILRYSPKTAGYASSVYELIGLGGVLAAGYASERFRAAGRFSVAAVMMFALAGLCAAYPYLSVTGLWLNVAAISMIGAFTFGPDTLMAGAATQEAASPESTASAGGFVNGVGSIGQIISPYVVAGLSSTLGWQALFAFLGATAFLGGVALIPVARRK
jgi:sugar phosphate permease